MTWMTEQEGCTDLPKMSDVCIGSWWQRRRPDKRSFAKPRRVTAVIEKDGGVRVHLAYADGRRCHKTVSLRTLLQRHKLCEAPLPPDPEPKQKNPRSVFDVQLGLEEDEARIQSIVRAVMKVLRAEAREAALALDDTLDDAKPV